ncbi:MAG TPA: hypothetical protein VFW66_08495 [Gemmatimonadales bacterium]|nr:hypothetical protein [Gemmatimonadales bacterium]
MTPRLHRLAVLALAAAMLPFGAISAHAQFGKRLGDAVRQNAENHAINTVVEHENRAIDAALSTKLSSADESAGDALYTSLKSDGRVTLQNVQFTSGTATLTDESAPTLKALGSMLKAHGDVRLRLEAYAESRDVSVARAQAIQEALVKAYGVDAGRVQPEGYKGKSGEERVEAVQL